MSDQGIQIDWPSAAQLLAQRLGEDAIEASVLAQLQQPVVSRVLVACSGGADSVFMLCVLVARAKELGLSLYLAHYNHRWRGEASDADAAFVESLGEALDLPFFMGERPVNEAAFTETTARALRLDFLRKTATRKKCTHIVYGHQLDDILETQLQRIGRGCASGGLAAPRPITLFEQYPDHLRPLLHLRSSDIRMALNTCTIPWLEDSSNSDVSIARNALRHKIIPDLEDALGRDPAIGAARTRWLLEEDAVALEHLAQEYLPDAYSGAHFLSRPKLQSVPRALVRRALSAWLGHHGLISSLSAPAMDFLIGLIFSEQESHRMSAGQAYLRLDSGKLTIERETSRSPSKNLQSTTLEPGQTVMLSTGAVMQAEWVEVNAELIAELESGTFDPASEVVLAWPDSEPCVIRATQPGDRYHPLGAPGSKKLKDCLIDRKLPVEERKRLPLVTSNAPEILWVPGLPPSEKAKILPTTKRALRLTYETRNPL